MQINPQHKNHGAFYKGIFFKLIKVEGKKNWYYQIDDLPVHDWYNSKAAARAAAVAWINYINCNKMDHEKFKNKSITN